MDTTTQTKTTAAFHAQAAISFAIALGAMLYALLYVPVDPWVRAFFAITTLYLTTSAFTLAKVIRDAQEHQQLLARLDQARVDRLIAEHEPTKVAS